MVAIGGSAEGEELGDGDVAIRYDHYPVRHNFYRILLY